MVYPIRCRESASGSVPPPFCAARAPPPGDGAPLGAAARASSRAMQVRLDSARCCGHGRCYALCPELFEEDESGHAVLLANEVPRAFEARVRAAAENCPELAITTEG